MPFPKTKVELEAQGYRLSNTGQCSARSCLAPIEWWWTPNKKKLPFTVSGETVTPHFADCPAAKAFKKR
jgi:hypothetical protein